MARTTTSHNGGSRDLARRSSTLLAMLGLMLAPVFLVAPAAHAAPVVDDLYVTVPEPSFWEVGDQIDVSVDVGGAADVFAYGVTVSYDPELVTYVADSASSTTSGYFQATGDPSGGEVTFVHTKLGTSPPSAGELNLLSLTLLTVGSGEPVVTFNAEFVSPSGSTSQVGGSLSLQESVSFDVRAEPTAPTPTPTTPTPTDGTDPTPTATPTTPMPPPTAADPGDGAGGWLPGTGSDLGSFVVLGALLLVGAGVALVWLQRKRFGVSDV